MKNKIICSLDHRIQKGRGTKVLKIALPLAEAMGLRHFCNFQIKLFIALFLFCVLLPSFSNAAKADQLVSVTAVNGNAKIYSSSELKLIANLQVQYSSLKSHIDQMKALYHDMLVSAVQLMQGGTDPQTTSQIGDSPIPYVVQMSQATSDLVGAQNIIDQNQAKLNTLKAQLDTAEQGSGIGTLTSSLTVLATTSLSSGYVVTADVNSYVTIKSGGETLTLTPGSQVYILANKADGAQLIDVLNGKASVNTGAGTGGMVIVSGNKVVTHKDTSLFVERNGDNYTIGSYDGVIGITDFSTLKFYAIPSGYQITFAGEEVLTEKIPSKKAELLYLSYNGSNSYSIKPLIELIFDDPIREESLYGNLMCSGTNYNGHFFAQGDNNVFFVPSKPVNKGACTFSLSGLDYYNNSLQYTSKFNTLCEKPDAGYYLSYPAAYKATKSFYVKNTLNKELIFHDVALYLFQNFSNAFVRIDSITPSSYELKKDSFGNDYVLWSAEQKIKPGKEFSYEINYTIFSFGINYFDFLDFDVFPTSSYGSFTTATTNIQSDHKEIKALAKKISGDTVLEKSHEIANWLSLNIIYDTSFTQDEGALATLRNNTGICNGYAALFAALARASGIPTKYTIGLLGNQGYHSFNEIYVGGQWIPIDPTGTHYPNDYFAVLYNSQLKEAELEDLSDSKESYYSYILEDGEKVYTYEGYEYATIRNVTITPVADLDPELKLLYYLLYLQDTESQSTYFDGSFGCVYYDNAKEFSEIFENCRKGQCDETVLKSKLEEKFDILYSSMGSYAQLRLDELQQAMGSGYPVPLSDTQALELAKDYVGYGKTYFDMGDYNNAIASLAYSNWLLFSTPTYNVTVEEPVEEKPKIGGGIKDKSTSKEETEEETGENKEEEKEETGMLETIAIAAVVLVAAGAIWSIFGRKNKKK